MQALENSESIALTSMARKRFLVLLPVQAWLLLAPAGQAQNNATTRFLPDEHRGPACRALAPECMTKKQWANYCSKSYPHANAAAMPQSCRDALASHDHPLPEPPTRFLPENHKGVACMALIPSCMTRAQWSELCQGRKKQDPNYAFPKSCRDALGLP